VAAVEGGVEAGDLRQFGAAREQCVDRRQIIGLVQRSERNVALEMRQHLGVHLHGAVVVGAAMHDAMANGDEIDLLRRAQPVPAW